MDWIIKLVNIGKNFVFHHQQGTELVVLDKFSREFYSGEVAVLSGRSGTGKSTLIRMMYAGYRTEKGKILVKHKNKTVDLASAEPAVIYDIRKETIGYVSQFLRVVPRVSALETVIEPLLVRGENEQTATKKGRLLMERLNIPEHLWHLSATTFSGGEQQRINIARGFIASYPILLLDEPTASLDAKNRAVVIELIEEAKAAGSCIIAVFHDLVEQKKIADRAIDMSVNAA